MSDFSVGDMAQLFLTKRQNASLKTDLTRLSTEVTTGLAADMAEHVSGDLAPLAGLTASLAQLAGHTTVNTEAGMMADAMQTALGTIDDQAKSVATVLLTSGNLAGAGRFEMIGFEAEQSLRTTLSALNARFGDRSLFAGQATTGPALPSADDVVADLLSQTAGLLTVQEISDSLDLYFADGGVFDTTIYQGGPPMGAWKIAPDESARLDLRATDPAIKATLKGLAMGMLLAHDRLANDPAAQAALSQKAGESLMASQTGRTQIAANLGTVQQRISEADTRNQAQMTALRIAQSRITSVDQYEAASRLQAVQTQLEALYTITARMARLNLADYLS